MKPETIYILILTMLSIPFGIMLHRIHSLEQENHAHEQRMETLLRWLESENLIVPGDEIDQT